MENKIRFLTYHFFSQPIVDFIDNIRSFLKFGLIFAFLLTALAFTFNEAYFCLIPSSPKVALCSKSVLAYASYFILKLIILSVFLKIWYDQTYLKKNITLEYFKMNTVSFLKFFVFFILFLLINCLPLVSFIVLIRRVPNPFWITELLFFTVVLTGFLVPFILMRFYTNLANYIEHGKWGSFKQAWLVTRQKSSKIIFSLMFLIVLCLIIFVVVNRLLYQHAFINSVLYEIMAEFFFELAFLLISTLLINFIYNQKKYFLKGEN